MNIFVLTSELNGHNGWGRYSLDLIGALSEKGIGSTVVTSERGLNERQSVCAILPDPLSYGKNYFLAPLYAWKLRKFAASCDLIHSFVEPYSYIAYWLSIFLGKPYFVTCHGTYGVIPFGFPAFKRYFHAYSLASAKQVICVSRYTEQRIAEYGSFNTVVINNGIRYANFSGSAQEKENIIVSVGSLKRRKGYHVSIPVFASVARRLPGFSYRIVGDQGDEVYFESLKKLAANLGVGDRVFFEEGLSDAELLNLYRKAKLFVLLPINEGFHFEGFGLVYLEANACGLPVIGTSGSGVEDAISDSRTGFLVPQNDLEKSGEAIMEFIERPGMSEGMSVSAVEWAKKHDWGTIAETYAELYRKL